MSSGAELCPALLIPLFLWHLLENYSVSASKKSHVPTHVQPARVATSRCELRDGALHQPLQPVQINLELF